MVAPQPAVRAQPRRRRAFERPNLGVVQDRPAGQVPPRAMVDCLNVRVRDGKVVRENQGWEPFFDVNLDSEQVLLIDNFIRRTGAQTLIFATKKDLFRFDEGPEEVRYLTPVYVTGQASCVGGTTVTGSGGTLWDTAKATGTGNNAEAGYEIAFGDNAETDPNATWYAIDSVTTDTSLELTAAGPNTGGAVDYTIRQVFDGDEFDRWDSAVFPDAQPDDEDLWIAGNGIDAVKYEDGAHAEWIDLGFSFCAVHFHQNIMVYGCLIEAGESKKQAFRTSAIGEPEDVTDDEASEFVATDGTDDILTMLGLGDFVVAYHRRAIALLQFVGPPLNWISRIVVPSIGPISAGAVMDFGDYHEFVGHDRGYRFDGAGIEEVGKQVFREALRTISPARIDRSFAHLDEENGEVHWIIPKTTDPGDEFSGPTMAVTEHYLEVESIRQERVPYTLRELPATATGYFERSTTLRWSDLVNEWTTYNFAWNDRFFEAAFPFNLFGDEDGNVWILGTQDSKNGAAIRSFARFGRFAVADGDRKGILHRIAPWATVRPAAGYSLTVKLYMADQFGGAASLVSTLLYNLTQVGAAIRRFVSPMKAGRYAEVEFETNGIDQGWEISGYEVSATVAGER